METKDIKSELENNKFCSSPFFIASIKTYFKIEYSFTFKWSANYLV
ncbi:hypothetical protein [Candidatus Uabimicrobium sp. HlEnr_7]